MERVSYPIRSFKLESCLVHPPTAPDISEIWSGRTSLYHGEFYHGGWETLGGGVHPAPVPSGAVPVPVAVTFTRSLRVYTLFLGECSDTDRNLVIAQLRAGATKAFLGYREA